MGFKTKRRDYKWDQIDKVFCSKEGRSFELGQIRVIDGKLWWASSRFIDDVEWSPVTKDMLHVPEEQSGDDE